MGLFIGHVLRIYPIVNVGQTFNLYITTPVSC